MKAPAVRLRSNSSRDHLLEPGGAPLVGARRGIAAESQVPRRERRSRRVAMTDDPRKIRLSRGLDLAFRTAGDSDRSALLLLHGLPNSSRNFRDVIEPLSRSVFVVA